MRDNPKKYAKGRPALPAPLTNNQADPTASQIESRRCNMASNLSSVPARPEDAKLAAAASRSQGTLNRTYAATF